jgi:hypothetical protein
LFLTWNSCGAADVKDVLHCRQFHVSVHNEQATFGYILLVPPHLFFVLLQVDENRFFSLLKNSFDFQGRQQQLPASSPYIFHFSIYLVNGEPVVNLQVADAKLAIPFVIQDDSVGSGGCRSQSNDSATLLFCLSSKQERKMGVSLQVL